MGNKSIPEIFRETAKQFSLLNAINFQGNQTSFNDVLALSENIAGSLQNSGIVPGDRVGLYCVNSDHFALAYMGIINAGATVVPINLLLTPTEISYILNDSGAKGLIYHEVFANTVSEFRHQVNSLNTFICVGNTRSLDSDLLLSSVLISKTKLSVVELNPDQALAAIMYTSGTTGKPKGAMLSHTNLASNTHSVIKSLKFTPGNDKLIAVLPMFHAFASTVCMLTPLLRGMTTVPVTRFEPELLANSIEQSQATILCAVPSMYNTLLNMPDRHIEKFRTLRFCVSGGAAMPEEIMRRFEDKFNIVIYEGYGPTECSPVTNVNPVGGKRKILSVGLPVADVNMCIKDENGNDLPNGEVGEICVDGPNVMAGYWNKPEETAQSFFGKWFRTGDLGKKDEEGYYYIVDRIKDMVIVNGMNVYPRVVEEVLYQHTTIQECAVVGQPDERHGEIVVAYVVCKPQQSLTHSDIRNFLSDKLGRYQIPKKTVFLESLPKNAAGKILKRELKQMSAEVAIE